MGKPLQLFSKWCQQNSWTTKCSIAVSSYQLYPSPGGIFPYTCFGLQSPAPLFAINKTIASAIHLGFSSSGIASSSALLLFTSSIKNVHKFVIRVEAKRMVIPHSLNQNCFVEFHQFCKPEAALMEQRKRQRCQNKDIIIKLHYVWDGQIQRVRNFWLLWWFNWEIWSNWSKKLMELSYRTSHFL